jgi:hypothetical protein
MNDFTLSEKPESEGDSVKCGGIADVVMGWIYCEVLMRFHFSMS